VSAKLEVIDATTFLLTCSDASHARVHKHSRGLHTQVTQLAEIDSTRRSATTDQLLGLASQALS
jgi:hypothetical protein